MSSSKPRVGYLALLLMATALTTVACCLSFVWNALLLRIQFALHLNDLGKFYYDAQAFAAGKAMYGFSPATNIPLSDVVSKQLLNLNPPHMHLVVLPFVGLAPASVLLLWLVSGVICVAGVTYAALRVSGARIATGWLLLGGLVLVSSAAFGSILITGQITMHLLPLIAWGWIAARRERWSQAAVALGVAISVKPFLLLFVPWLAIRGRSTAACLSLLVAASCFAAGVAVFGVENHAAWLAAISAIDWHGLPLNASLRALLERTLADTFYFEPLIHAPEALLPLWLTGFVAIGLTSLAIVFADRSAERVDRAFCILILAALLMCPLGWVYYVLLALPPAIGLLASPREASAQRPGGQRVVRGARTVALIAAGVLMLVPTQLAMAGQPSAGLTITLGCAHFWAVFLFWFSACVDGVLSLSAQGVTLRGPAGFLSLLGKRARALRRPCVEG